MTSYNKFNKWVFNYYLDNCILNEINSLSIPLSEIEEFVNEYDIALDSFKEVNSRNWFYLLKEKEGIPQYLGLIALQCLAAFKMQNQNGKTAANFKIPFADLVGIMDVNDLTIFFSEEYDDDLKVQEKIWYSAQLFFKNRNIKIILPKKTRYAGRFIQFPKSQIVLNHEDLKEYNLFFTEISKEFECISFDDFKKFYFNEITSFRGEFRRENNTKNESQLSKIERKIKLKQIFDFYCSDDWTSISKKNKIGNDISNKNYIIKFSPDELLLYDQHHKRLEDLNSLIKNNSFMIFKENKYYPNEFESVNSISIEGHYVLLIYRSAAYDKEIRESIDFFLPVSYKNQKHNILIFKIESTDKLPGFLVNKVFSEYPIELKGFKLLGEKKYFVDHPPTLHLKENIHYHIYHNKKRIDKNQINKIGKYLIKVNGYSNYNFELVELPFLEYSINDKSKFLNFNYLDYNDEELGGINGLLLKYKDNVRLEILTINNWIETIKGGKVNSYSQLLKTIANSRNGKY